MKIHVNKGCLSNIPVGHGTNRNESIHKQLNALLHRSRISIQTAHSLFAFMIYDHNCKSEKKLNLPIWFRNVKDPNPFMEDEHPIENGTWEILENLELENENIHGDHSYSNGMMQ